MIHRDLKPANLMVVDYDTPREKIKVMDFGLAKLLDTTTIKSVTESNFDFAVGTPGYICPEQVRGDKVDHRGDLYSVGVILYELLSGRLPFVGPTSMDLMLAHATEPPPSFSELELGDLITGPVEDVVMQCLAKDPAERPQSAREMTELFTNALKAGDKPRKVMMAELVDEDEEDFEQPFRPDPTALTFQMEAYMPEAIAVVKLKGFAHDLGGNVVDSVPGVIRLTIGGVPARSGRKGGSVRSRGWGSGGGADLSRWNFTYTRLIR